MVTDACRRLAIDRSDYRFSRREVREHTGWGNTQLKLHLRRLEEMEYLVVHSGRRGQSFVYELVYDGEGEDGRRFLLGLIDSGHHYDEEKSGVSGNRSGSEGEKSAPGRPQVGPKSGGGRSAPTSRKPLSGNGSLDSTLDVGENAHLDQSEAAPSYRSVVLARGR